MCESIEQELPQPKKPKKRMKKWKRRLIKLGIFLFFVMFVAFIVGCYTILPLPILHSSHPENVAEDYAIACMNDNMDALYKCYEFEDSPFLSEKLFTKTFSEHIKNSTSYTVTKDAGASSGSNKVYRIAFRGAHQAKAVSSQAILVTKTDERTLYIFDHWVLSSQNLLTKNITLILPSCGKPYLDDIPLTKGKSTKVSGQKKYTIGTLFAGSHTLRYIVPGHKDYKKTFTTPYEDMGNRIVTTLDTSMLKLSDQGKKQCASLAMNTFYNIYNNALKKQSFDTVFKNIDVEKDFIKALKSFYNTLVNDSMTKGTNFYIKELKIKSAKTNVEKCTFSPDGHPAATVQLKAKYKATSKVKKLVGKKTIIKKKKKKVRVKVYKKNKKGKKTKKYKWVTKVKTIETKKKKNVIKTFTKPLKGTANCHFTFHLKNGKWVLYDTNAMATKIIH